MVGLHVRDAVQLRKEVTAEEASLGSSMYTLRETSTPYIVKAVKQAYLSFNAVLP